MTPRRSSPRPEATLPARVEEWLAGRRLWIVAAIAGVSALLRIVYFVQLSGSPCAVQHRWVQTDMHFFDEWARVVAEGDWLTDRSLHPHLGWHDAIAAKYLAENPEEASRLAESADADGPRLEASRRLWDRWYGGPRFHQGPLYPYLVALTYLVLGDDVRGVFAWQLALGVLGNVLIWAIARRAFGRTGSGHTVAAVAGALAAFCGPLLFYEMVLLRTALITFTGLLLVWLTQVVLERTSWASWLGWGAVFGLAMLLKSTFAPFGVGVLGLLGYLHRRRPVRLLRPVLGTAAGVLLAMAPLVARNVAVGAPPLSSSSVGALAFLCSNTEDVPPDAGFFVGSRHLTGILARTDGRFLETVVETLGTHPGIGSWARQAWGKLREAWHWYEKPNNASFYYYALHAPVLRWAAVTFLLIAPLAIVGLALGLPRFPSAGPLYFLVATSLAPLVLFYVLSRFRAPLVAASIPFAALTVVWLFERFATRRYLPGALALGAVLLVSGWTALPWTLPPDRPLVRTQDYSVAVRYFYAPEADAAAARGDWAAFAELARRSLEVEPESLRDLGAGNPARDVREARLCGLFAVSRENLARALEKLGDAEGAERERRRAAELRRAAAPWRKHRK